MIILPCPLCGSTITSRKITTCRQTSNSTVECVDTEYVVCEICGCTAPKQAWQNKEKGLTMTREELIEELNKIDGIEVENHEHINTIEIYTEKIIIKYDFSDDLRIGRISGCVSVYIENRTPEQVLSVVKALVG